MFYQNGDDSGYMKLMFPHSGHYRPGEAHMQRLLYHVHESGVDLTTFDVDMQQMYMKEILKIFQHTSEYVIRLI